MNCDHEQIKKVNKLYQLKKTFIYTLWCVESEVKRSSMINKIKEQILCNKHWIQTTLCETFIQRDEQWHWQWFENYWCQ
jgi:hypothetical protein